MKRRMFAGADKIIFQRAERLRKQQTFAEEILWNYLRTKPFGHKFRRQHPFANYILDFYCHALKLAIEVDGSVHDLEDVKQNDEQRQSQLEDLGLSMLRFKNEVIIATPENVIKEIESYIERRIKDE